MRKALLPTEKQGVAANRVGYGLGFARQRLVVYCEPFNALRIQALPFA
jgi:hypothetical protein